MNSLYMRSGAALLCAATLAACGGGGGGSMLLGGSISGMNRGPLVLTNNGGADLTIKDPASSFVFPGTVEGDASFNIQVKSSPTGQECKANNNTGKANYYSVSQTQIICTTFDYQLGGTITGLDTLGLVLANGSSTVSLVPGMSSFVFPAKVPNGAPYGVSVLAQPAGKTCTVANFSGIMPIADKLDLVVTCN